VCFEGRGFLGESSPIGEVENCGKLVVWGKGEGVCVLRFQENNHNNNC
jgi:hypothetical protein